MLSVHDIPEAIITDVTVIEKDLNPDLAAQLEQAEIAAAPQLLHEDDIKLLDEFNAAGRFLKGDSQAVESVTSTGILAKVLDSIDGNIGFHFFVTEWIKSGKQELPIETMQRAFVKTFEQQRIFRTQLTTLPAGLNLSVATANQILDHQARHIMLVWSQIPEEKIPQPVLGELIKLQQELEVVLD